MDASQRRFCRPGSIRGTGFPRCAPTVMPIATNCRSEGMSRGASREPAGLIGSRIAHPPTRHAEVAAMPYSCLIIERHPDAGATAARALPAFGFRPFVARSAERALGMLRQWRFDAALVDADGFGAGYVDVLQQLRPQFRSPVILLSTSQSRSPGDPQPRVGGDRGRHQAGIAAPAGREDAAPDRGRPRPGRASRRAPAVRAADDAGRQRARAGRRHRARADAASVRPAVPACVEMPAASSIAKRLRSSCAAARVRSAAASTCTSTGSDASSATAASRACSSTPSMAAATC